MFVHLFMNHPWARFKNPSKHPTKKKEVKQSNRKDTFFIINTTKEMKNKIYIIEICLLPMSWSDSIVKLRQPKRKSKHKEEKRKTQTSS